MQAQANWENQLIALAGHFPHTSANTPNPFIWLPGFFQKKNAPLPAHCTLFAAPWMILWMKSN